MKKKNKWTDKSVKKKMLKKQVVILFYCDFMGKFKCLCCV